MFYPKIKNFFKQIMPVLPLPLKILTVMQK